MVLAAVLVVGCGDDGATGPAANRAPTVVGVIPDQTVHVGETATLDVSARFTDPDGDALTYGASSSDPSVAIVSASGSTVAITALATGAATITVSASDPAGLTATQSFEATVPNRAPVATGSIPAQSLTPRQSTQVDLAPFFSDPDGDALTYEATSSNDGVATAAISGDIVTVTAVAEGSATIQITARDPGRLSARQSFGVTVEDDGGGDFETLSGFRVRSDGGITLRVGAIIQSVGKSGCINGGTYNGKKWEYHETWWQRDSGSGWQDVPGTKKTGRLCGYDLSSASSGKYRGVGDITAADVRGKYKSENEVSVGGGSNQAPVATGSIPAQSLTPGQSTQVDLAPFFNDPDGDALTYTASSSNAGIATVSVSGGTLTVTAVAAGTATVSVTATDPGELSASQTIPVTVTEGGGTSGDRAALVALYNATDGPNWLDNDNWLTDAPLGEWYGVDTDASGRVVALDLGGTYRDDGEYAGPGLSGAIAPEIGALTRLVTLDLHSNDLSGAIPPELGELANLTTLDLRWNDLTGEIPPELGDLAKLKVLRFYSNDLSGDIPPELGNLTSLTYLGLGLNGLTGRIPPTLGRLASLESLILRINRLTGPIPPELGNLASLDQLWLWENNLSGPIPPELGNLASLTELHLSRNNLSGPIPTELGDLASLEELLLSENELTGTIPPKLGNLTSLESLSLWNNELTGTIPPELGNLTSLTYLGLRYNKLTGPIPPELGNLTSLESLSLGYNKLTGTIPPELGNLTSLTHLDLRYNAGLTGPLPLELQSLVLDAFYWNDTGLCSPDNSSFQAWLDAIEEHRGGSVCQDGGDFEAFSGLRINNDGSVTLKVGSITLSAGKTGCISGGGTLNGKVYDYHWTAWQRNTGSGWSEVSGSRQTGKLCGYDLTSAPSGKYRLVGDMTLAGTRAKYKSENEVTVGGGGSNQSPVTVGTIPANTVKAGASVSVNASSYFSDPDEDVLTYTASSSRTSVATASVSGHSVTVAGVAEGTATIRITATDPGGLSAVQTFSVTVETGGGGDFEAFSGLRINNDGSVTLKVGSITLSAGKTGCMSGGGTLNGKVYDYHWTAWQRNTGSGWSEVSGSRQTGKLCGYDLTSAPSGKYRLVGDMTLAGTRAKYKSENEVSR